MIQFESPPQHAALFKSSIAKNFFPPQQLFLKNNVPIKLMDTVHMS